MKTPKISILTICLNDREGLAATIKSVDAGLVPGVEHVIKDGGSQDGTLDFLKSMPPTPVRRWYSTNDLGIYDAMNQSISLAEGDFVLMLNSGDTLKQTTLLLWMEHLASNPDTDMICCNLQWNRLTGDPIFLHPPMEIRNPTLMPVWHQSTLIRKSLHDIYGFYRTDYKMISDMIFYHQAFSHARRYHLDFVSSEMAAGGISETQRWNQFKEFVKYLKEIKAPFKEYLRLMYKNFPFRLSSKDSQISGLPIH